MIPNNAIQPIITMPNPIMGNAEENAIINLSLIFDTPFFLDLSKIKDNTNTTVANIKNSIICGVA